MTEKEQALKDIRDDLELTIVQARKLLGSRPSLRMLKNVQRVLKAMSWSSWSNEAICLWFARPNEQLLSQKPIVLARTDEGMKTLLNYLQGKRRKHRENERSDRFPEPTQRGQYEAAAVMANIYYYGRR